MDAAKVQIKQSDDFAFVYLGHKWKMQATNKMQDFAGNYRHNFRNISIREG